MSGPSTLSTSSNGMGVSAYFISISPRRVWGEFSSSTRALYCLNRLFEAVGIAKDVVDEYFTNTVSRIGGIGLEEIEAMGQIGVDRPGPVAQQGGKVMHVPGLAGLQDDGYRRALWPLFDYFRQRFAQVTNPPIDAIREEIVTDTAVYVGDDGNLLEERAENCRVLQIHNPILTSVDMLKIKHMDRPGFRVETVSLLYFKNMPLKRALDQMKLSADRGSAPVRAMGRMASLTSSQV